MPIVNNLTSTNKFQWNIFTLAGLPTSSQLGVINPGDLPFPYHVVPVPLVVADTEDDERTTMGVNVHITSEPTEMFPSIFM